MMSMSGTGRSNRFPFTTSQWQELEHQALIFKYMVSGIPIPPDLLFSIKTSFDSSLPSKLILQPQHVGWNCFQMGFGRKIDPEPGRCRRTDGKKWRCSKEAYPDSKYCERHMHRGRNRSRKPVELVNNINTTTTSSSTNLDPKIPQQTCNISSITRNYTNPPSNFPPQSNHPTCSTTTTTHFLSPLSSMPSESESDSHHNNHHPCFSNHHQHNSSGGTATLHHPFLYPHSSSSSRPPGIGLSSQDSNTHFLLDSSPYSHSDKDFRNRYGQGMKEEGDRHAFYQETCGTMRSMSGSSVGDSWHLEPLTMGSSSSIMAHQKQRNSSALRSPYSSSSSSSSYLQLSDTPKQNHHHHQQQQQYYMMGSNRGSDLKCEMAFKSERVCGDDEPQKVMHHFFDEWPPTNKDSTTQLSISIPTAASHDFFMSHNDK